MGPCKALYVLGFVWGFSRDTPLYGGGGIPFEVVACLVVIDV